MGMKIVGTKAFVWILSLLLIGVFFQSCAKDEIERLPDVVTQGIPENEKVRNTIVSEGFTIDIHITYAEIVSYAGKATSVIIPESATGVPVKLIGEGAFQNNTTIKKVILPSTTLTIGRYSFEGCSALDEVIFNDGLETISDYAFRNSGLSTLSLPDSVASIGSYSFYNTKIEVLDIPDSVSRLKKFAFYGCKNLQTISFCPRLYEIGENVFYNCTALTEVIIPKTVTIIGNYAFSSCASLVKVVIPAETETIGVGVFMNCPELTIYGPAGSAVEKHAGRNNYTFQVVNYDAFIAEQGT